MTKVFALVFARDLVSDLLLLGDAILYFCSSLFLLVWGRRVSLVFIDSAWIFIVVLRELLNPCAAPLAGMWSVGSVCMCCVCTCVMCVCVRMLCACVLCVCTYCVCTCCVYMCMHSHEGYRRLVWVGKWHTIFLIQLLLFAVQKALHTFCACLFCACTISLHNLITQN